MMHEDCDLTPDLNTIPQAAPLNCDKCGAPIGNDGYVEGFGKVTAQEAIQRIAVMARIEPHNALAMLLRVVEKMPASQVAETLKRICKDVKMNQGAQHTRFVKLATIYPSLKTELRSGGWIKRRAKRPA